MMRYTLWDELRRMQEQMDRLFTGFFGREPFASTQLLEGPAESRDVALSDYRQPISDIYETDKEVVATLELPGIEKKDIEINATEEGVEVKVEKKSENEEKKKGLYRLERSYAGFYRYIPTPAGIDANKIKASYKNGVLELRMPKSKSEQKGKRISVN